MHIKANTIISRKHELLLSFCLVTSADTILFGTNANSVMVLIPRIVAILGILGICNFKSIRKNQFYGLLVLLIIAAISFLINKVNIETGISKILFILLGFSIASRFSIQSFFKIYDKVLYIVACSAIFLELISYGLPSLCTHLIPITNEAGTRYASILVSSININDLHTLFIRSSGIYWEAGAFAIYLLFGLIAQLFIFDEVNIKKVIIYLISMFMTFSTTGAIAVSVLLFTFLLSKKVYDVKDRRIKWLIIIIAVVFLVFFMFGEQNLVYDKLFGKITNNSSTTRTRVTSLIVPFEIAKASPLFGVGPNKVGESMVTFANASTYDLQASNMCTNTFTYQFAAYGFLYGFFFFIRNWIFCRTLAFKKIGLTIGLILSITLAYAGENFYSFLPYVFVFLSYCKMEGGKKNCENCCNK